MAAVAKSISLDDMVDRAASMATERVATKSGVEPHADL